MKENQDIKILHLMVGLPRSGKSTQALAMGLPVVCPDSIRQTLHGTLWRNEAEPMVWAIAHMMVESLFLAGHNEVVLDACNVAAKRRKEWESPKWACTYHVIETSKDDCIARALLDGKEELVPVIERMAAVWSPPGMGEDC